MYMCGWSGQKTVLTLKELEKSNEEQLQAGEEAVYICITPDPLVSYDIHKYLSLRQTMRSMRNH